MLQPRPGGVGEGAFWGLAAATINPAGSEPRIASSLNPASAAGLSPPHWPSFPPPSQRPLPPKEVGGGLFARGTRAGSLVKEREQGHARAAPQGLLTCTPATTHLGAPRGPDVTPTMVSSSRAGPGVQGWRAPALWPPSEDGAMGRSPVDPLGSCSAAQVSPHPSPGTKLPYLMVDRMPDCGGQGCSGNLRVGGSPEGRHVGTETYASLGA